MLQWLWAIYPKIYRILYALCICKCFAGIKIWCDSIDLANLELLLLLLLFSLPSRELVHSHKPAKTKPKLKSHIQRNTHRKNGLFSISLSLVSYVRFSTRSNQLNTIHNCYFICDSWMHKSQQHINIHSASEHTSLKTISILFFSFYFLLLFQMDFWCMCMLLLLSLFWIYCVPVIWFCKTVHSSVYACSFLPLSLLCSIFSGYVRSLLLFEKKI